jgi:hypothetical protein
MGKTSLVEIDQRRFAHDQPQNLGAVAYDSIVVGAAPATVVA